MFHFTVLCVIQLCNNARMQLRRYYADIEGYLFNNLYFLTSIWVLALCWALEGQRWMNQKRLLLPCRILRQMGLGGAACSQLDQHWGEEGSPGSISAGSSPLMPVAQQFC